MKIFVSIRLRKCTRCGHEECPCCNNFCDVCVFDEGNAECNEAAECIYTEPRDEEGYKRLGEAMSRFPNGADMVDAPGGISVQDEGEAKPCDDGFGDGSDGVVNFDGVTPHPDFSSLADGVYTLTRDVQLAGGSSITGATLDTNGFWLGCNGTFTIKGTSA